MQLNVVAFPDYLLIKTIPYLDYWVIGAVAISAVPDSNDSGCFIATAANGSPVEPNAVGKGFVSTIALMLLFCIGIFGLFRIGRKFRTIR